MRFIDCVLSDLLRINKQSRLCGLIFFSCVLGVFSLEARKATKSSSSSKAPQLLSGEYEGVDADLLMQQAVRLVKVLENMGTPLETSEMLSLENVARIKDPQERATGIEKIFDKRCLAVLRLNEDKELNAKVTMSNPVLVENGWQSYLVKVVNEGSFRSSLWVRSLDVGNPFIEKSSLSAKFYEADPMGPQLSGTPLEYRVIQIYCDDDGELNGGLKFGVRDVDSGDGRIIKFWNFNDNSEGWEPARNTELVTNKGSIKIDRVGKPSQIIKSISGVAAGAYQLRMWCRSAQDAIGYLSWRPPGTTLMNDSDSLNLKLPIYAGIGGECRVSFNSDVDITQFLIAFHASAPIEVDWISLEKESTDLATDSISMSFVSKPAVTLKFEILDESIESSTASFLIRDSNGTYYPIRPMRKLPDLNFQQHIYRASGENVRLPAGSYSIVASKGPEYVSQNKSITLNAKPISLLYKAKRWVNPREHSYFSGDVHLRAWESARHTRNKELIPTAVLESQLSGESISSTLLYSEEIEVTASEGSEVRIFNEKVKTPLNAFDLGESVNGNRRSGHLNFIAYEKIVFPETWSTLGLKNLKWAKRIGLVTGTSHTGIGLLDKKEDLSSEGEPGPQGLPNFDLPSFSSIGTNELLVNVTHEVDDLMGARVPAIDFISIMNIEEVAELNIWYHLLNCGFRPKIAGESDFPGVLDQRIGSVRTYVKLPDEFNEIEWIRNLKAGRSYVSNGAAHIIDFKLSVINDSQKSIEPGIGNSELNISGANKFRIDAKAAVLSDSTEPIFLEAVVNGYPAAVVDLQPDGKLTDIVLDIDLDESSWVALRIKKFAHSNPVFVQLNAEPLKPNRHSVEWCLKGVDLCWKARSRDYPDSELEQAEAAYKHAKDAYSAMLE